MNRPAIPLRHPLLTSLLVIVLLFGASLMAIRSFIREERHEDHRSWQVMLESLADAKANAINGWLGEQFSILEQLATNPSLMLYSQQLQVGDHGSDPERAELVFLKNLILTTAERHGFVPSLATAAIEANVTMHADNGLALYDAGMRQLLATPGFSVPPTALTAKAKEVMATGQAAILDIAEVDGHPVVGFITPYSGLRTMTPGASAIGVAVGYKGVATTLFPLLKARTNTKEEAVLLRRDGEVITFLSPLADGTPALGRHTQSQGQQAEAFAWAHPGAFNELPDHAGTTILFTSRAIKHTPWLLLQQIRAEEALAESRAHQRSLIITLTLTTLLVAALLAAAWWHGASVRRAAYAQEMRLASEELTAKSRLLDAVNANTSDLILLVDPSDQCLFANPPLARQVGADAADLTAKSLTNIFGAAPATALHAGMAQALAHGGAFATTLTIAFQASSHQFHAIFTPLGPGRDDPQGGLATPGSSAGVLITLHDMTEITQAQRRESLLFQQLIRALMKAIDLHDPYSANHSAKTAALAMAMGRAMGLGAEEMTTLEIAANLCNLGKLSIPREVLTKDGGLTREEMDTIRQEAQYAADLLRDLEFPGPLQMTILQKHEFLDGSGHPLHLQGEEIITTARVLAVANAFVAMISPRAYRDKMEDREALRRLMGECGTRYDRKAVAALFQVVENEQGWESAAGTWIAGNEKG